MTLRKARFKMLIADRNNKQKNKNKVIEFLKEVSSGTISSLIATGILAKFGIQ